MNDAFWCSIVYDALWTLSAKPFGEIRADLKFQANEKWNQRGIRGELEGIIGLVRRGFGVSGGSCGLYLIHVHFYIVLRYG